MTTAIGTDLLPHAADPINTTGGIVSAADLTLGSARLQLVGWVSNGVGQKVPCRLIYNHRLQLQLPVCRAGVAPDKVCDVGDDKGVALKCAGSLIHQWGEGTVVINPAIFDC